MIVDPDTVALASRNLMAVGFGVALLATSARKYWGYALVALVALVEAFADYRYPFHDWMRINLLGVHEDAGAKGVLQSTLLYVSAMLCCIVLLLLIPYLVRAAPGRRLMVFGGVVMAGMLAIELISPHHIDAIIYHPAGPFTRSAIVYFVAAMAVAGGALMTRRQQRSSYPSALGS